MNPVLPRIVVGIVLTHPAVVVHRDVQRLRAVANVVPQPSHVEDDRLFNRLGVFPLCRESAILAHRRLQPLIHLGCDIRLQSDLLWPQLGGHIWMRQPRRIQRGNEVIAPAWQMIPDHIGEFQIDEMLRRLCVVQLRLARRPPAVRLRPQVLDLVDRRRAAEKSRQIGRKMLDREPIDHAVSLAAPAEAGCRGHQAE